MATAPNWITAISSFRRLAASPCGGVARLKGPARRSRSPTRRMAGTSAARARRCLHGRRRAPARRPASTWGCRCSSSRRTATPSRTRATTGRPRALKKAQRRVARRTKGSHRRKKAAQQCAKRHQHVRRQRGDFHHKTALALVRQYDMIHVEAIQAANLSRRPAPIPDGAGSYGHNGTNRKAGLNTSIHAAGMGPLPVHPRVQGSMRREASGSGQSRVYVPRIAQAAGRASSRASPCAPTSARTAD